jgi:4-amino-4-deoxy-L-arabinose transferase-like glycosyltransferase
METQSYLKSSLKHPLSIVGIVLIVGSTLLLILIIDIKSYFQEPFERYNNREIAMFGEDHIASVTKLKKQDNIRIFGESPVIIYYEYQINGQKLKDKFITMESDKINNLAVGDEISIKAYQGESIIDSTKPFRFPYLYFQLVPLYFILMGFILILAGFLRVSKKMFAEK